MKLFDSIRHSLNPEIKKTFDYLYENYYKGLKSFCDSDARDSRRNGSRAQNARINLSDPSYSDMKRIYESKDAIIKIHESILLEEQIDADKKELKSLQESYPHAFAHYCNESLGGTIIYSSLKYPDIKKLLAKKDLFAAKEKEIIDTLRNKAIQAKFDNEVRNNKRRVTYYKTFLAAERKTDKDIEYVTEHLNELDQFIVRLIDKQYESIKLEFPLGILEYEKGKYFGETEADRKERVVNNLEVIKELEKARKKYNRLKTQYPKGLPAFEQYTTYDDGKNSAELSLQEIVECEEEIAKFERYADEYARYKLWEKEQGNFASDTRKLHPEKWGCYCYDVGLPCVGPNGDKIQRKYRVWQHFYGSYCQRSTNDTLPKEFWYLKEKSLDNFDFYNKKLSYKDIVYEQVLKLILAHREKFGDVLVIFGSSGLATQEAISLNNYQFRYLKEKLASNNIPYWMGDENKDCIAHAPRHILVVELISTNEGLRQSVKKVRDELAEIQPLIAYVSLRKCYDPSEVEKLVANAAKKRQEELAREEAEKKRAKEEAERHKREEERRQKEKANLFDCVSDWHTHSWSTVKHKWGCSYYAYRDYKDYADEEMWDTWRFIWDFKNDPSRHIPEADHDRALGRAIRWTEDVLSDTFGSDLNKLTLVCLTASSRLKNDMRFKAFAEEVCNDLNMNNAYEHIHIVSDGEAKHEGGSVAAGKSYDTNWFKDKYVVLFDDVRTSGNSIENEKKILESLGAIVICAVTLAQTI